MEGRIKVTTWKLYQIKVWIIKMSAFGQLRSLSAEPAVAFVKQS